MFFVPYKYQWLILCNISRHIISLYKEHSFFAMEFFLAFNAIFTLTWHSFWKIITYYQACKISNFFAKTMRTIKCCIINIYKALSFFIDLIFEKFIYSAFVFFPFHPRICRICFLSKVSTHYNM